MKKFFISGFLFFSVVLTLYAKGQSDEGQAGVSGISAQAALVSG